MTLVFGGSFNPPTIAHLKIMETLLAHFANATLLILPVGNDYSKPELELLEHRHNMLKLLTKDYQQIKILDLEGKREYLGTLASLDELAKEYQNIHFVIGADQIEQIDKWINYRTLLKKYPFIVMDRNNLFNSESIKEKLTGIEYNFKYLDFDINISGTAVRSNHENRKKGLTKEVLDYIEKNNLYEEKNDV